MSVAIAFKVGASNGNLGANGSVTATGLTTSGASLILISASVGNNSLSTVSGVTVGGNAATLGKRQVLTDAFSNAEVWWFWSTGALASVSVVVTFANSAGAGTNIDICEATGTDSSSIGNVGGANGSSGTSAASAVCSATGSVMYASSLNFGSSGTEAAGTNTTLLNAQNDGAGDFAGSSINNQATTSGTTYTVTTTHATGLWAMAVVEVKPAGSGGSTPTVLPPVLGPGRAADTLSSGARSYVAYPPVSPAPPAAPAMSWQSIAPRLVVAATRAPSAFVAAPATTPAAPALPPMGWLVPQVRQPIATPAASLGQRRAANAYQAALPGVLTFSWMMRSLFVPPPPIVLRPSSPVAPLLPPAGFFGTGAAAFSPFAVSASGLLTFSGTGSAALQSFAVSAAALETFLASATAAIQSFAATASGSEGFSGPATAASQPFASSAAGAETFSGSASSALQPFAASGAGAEGFIGSATAAIQSFASSAVALEGFLGTAAAVLSRFDALGAADGIITGAALASMTQFAVAATALETFSGNATASLAAFAALASATESFLASATAALASFASSGTGITTTGFVGSASASMASFAALAAAVETFTGSVGAAMASFEASSGNVVRAPRSRVGAGPLRAGRRNGGPTGTGRSS